MRTPIETDSLRCTIPPVCEHCGEENTGFLSVRPKLDGSQLEYYWCPRCGTVMHYTVSQRGQIVRYDHNPPAAGGASQ